MGEPNDFIHEPEVHFGACNIRLAPKWFQKHELTCAVSITAGHTIQMRKACFSLAGRLLSCGSWQLERKSPAGS
jgi:hypothetical protein